MKQPAAQAASQDDDTAAAATEGEAAANIGAKKLVDAETLMRLIDECREEEDRLGVIAGVELSLIHI